MSLRNFLLFLLALTTLLVIFIGFPYLPRYLFFDEVEFARLSVDLQHHGYIPYSELATGHATLYFYIILLSFKVFGVSNFALRFPAAIFGALCVLLFYLMMSHVFKKGRRYGISLLLAFIFISLRWYFNFARFAFEATFLLFLELTSLYYLFRYDATKSKKHLFVSAIAAGLSFHSYYPGRIFILVPLFLLVIKRLKYIFLYFLTFFIVISPLVWHLSRHPDTRFQSQLFLNNPQYSLADKMAAIGENIYKNILMVTVSGDMNGRHNYPGKPAINPIISLFFISGIFFATKQIRKNIYHQLFLLYFFIGVLPSLFTYPFENPNMLRTFTTIPSLVYFVGVSINHFLTQRFIPIKKHYLIVGLFLIFLFSFLYELRTYFFFQDAVFRDDAYKIKQELHEVVTM